METQMFPNTDYLKNTIKSKNNNNQKKITI